MQILRVMRKTHEAGLWRFFQMEKVVNLLPAVQSDGCQYSDRLDEGCVPFQGQRGIEHWRHLAVSFGRWMPSCSYVNGNRSDLFFLVSQGTFITVLLGLHQPINNLASQHVQTKNTLCSNQDANVTNDNDANADVL